MRKGTKNSQFNTMWITKNGINKKIKKQDYSSWVSDGWVAGRYFPTTHGQKQKQDQETNIQKPRTCKTCGVIFLVDQNSARKCCSDYCARVRGLPHTEDTKKKISQRVQEQYANGKKVYGGTTKWIPYKNIKVQGSYELRTCVILDKMKELGQISDWSYTNDRISYINETGNKSWYLLDFKVITPTRIYYIETKGYVKPRDLLKWEAARDQIDLEVWFLEDIVARELVLAS